MPVRVTTPVIADPLPLVAPLSRLTMKLTSETPSSPSIGEPIETVKTEESLSVILAVELSEVLIVPSDGAEIVAIIVSVISTTESSIIITVIVAEFAPSGIVNELGAE